MSETATLDRERSVEGPGAVGREPTETADTPRRQRSRAERLEIVLLPIIVVVGFLLFVWWRNSASLDSVEESALDWGTLKTQLFQHLEITFISTVIVVAIAVPLGVALTRPPFRKATGPVTAVVNFGQAAPTVGLLVLFFMFTSSHSLFGVTINGLFTAVIALSAYAILPVLANTIAGLEAVDRTLVEAGRGVGMTQASTLLRIELPLALPVIMAGIRTALVLLVGTATLATFVSAGGLGDSLTAGITLFRYPVIVSTALLVALLALLIEWLGRVLEMLARPKGL